jgi:hypothetical protein
LGSRYAMSHFFLWDATDKVGGDSLNKKGTGMPKLLIVLGILLVIGGLSWNFLTKIPWIGRLPGDIFIQKKNFTFYFPLATSLLISAVLSFFILILSKR